MYAFKSGIARREATVGAGSRAVKKSLLLCGCWAVSLTLSPEALAQGTTLPPVTVESKALKVPKKSATKSAPQSVPQAPAAVPAPQAQTTEVRDKARSEAVYSTPASVSTAGKGELDTFGQIDTSDVLRSMPGTFTRESPQNPGMAVNIRGLEGSGRVNMMIDGVRQNFRFTGHEAQGFAYVDPVLLAGVDIARGAVSTVGGAGALVGVANLRTLDVDDISNRGQFVRHGLHASLNHADCSVWSRDTDKLLRQQSSELQRLWSRPDVPVDRQGTILADRLQAAGIVTCKIGDKESTNVAVSPMIPEANSGAAGPSVL